VSEILVIDDTGDRKKGHHTDYVKRQYINLGKIENGIVAVTAYGVIDNITIPCYLRFTNPKNDSKRGYLPQQARNCSRDDA